MLRSRLLGTTFSKVPRATPFGRCRHASSQNSLLPKLAQTSIWHSIIPRGIRDRWTRTGKYANKKAVNPASYFIWIYLLIGSQSIRIMGIQTDFNTYMRKADLKLNKLREVVEKLQKGEPVDVEKALGTGDEIQEQEWEDALQELMDEERVWQNNRKKAREESERLAQEERDANPLNTSIYKDQAATTIDIPSASSPTGPRPSPGFY
ncbi:uncharacterized protein A1O9_04383 [Exophiala aquamarina CBS 119918]|uniref:Uncharacterized protein n=1 Tax=Exophiala aquamarina CBS 119918 TaxID=1182545 RepID=A0A072PHC6_9EURO|nr:uncharacterized protein A1O9_04383 [Exophiala aquamarina CBS 119918]KEF59539.1 hypothetical protein A1O9_04383 [Exophiala aquamarina CBS 119918]